MSRYPNNLLPLIAYRVLIVTLGNTKISLTLINAFEFEFMDVR